MIGSAKWVVDVEASTVGPVVLEKRLHLLSAVYTGYCRGSGATGGICRNIFPVRARRNSQSFRWPIKLPTKYCLVFGLFFSACKRRCRLMLQYNPALLDTVNSAFEEPQHMIIFWPCAGSTYWIKTNKRDLKSMSWILKVHKSECYCGDFLSVASRMENSSVRKFKR